MCTFSLFFPTFLLISISRVFSYEVEKFDFVGNSFIEIQPNSWNANITFWCQNYETSIDDQNRTDFPRDWRFQNSSNMMSNVKIQDYNRLLIIDHPVLENSGTYDCCAPRTRDSNTYICYRRNLTISEFRVRDIRRMTTVEIAMNRTYYFQVFNVGVKNIRCTIDGRSLPVNSRTEVYGDVPVSIEYTNLVIYNASDMNTGNYECTSDDGKKKFSMVRGDTSNPWNQPINHSNTVRIDYISAVLFFIFSYSFV